MVGRIAGFLAVAVALCMSLSACDPAPPSAEDAVSLNVDLNADGSATANMFLDCGPRGSAQLHAWGAAVGSRLFPSASSLDVGIDPNGGVCPFVVITAPGQYQPGPQPRASVDSRDAVSWLLSNGIKTVDVYLDSPRVPLTSSWTPARGADEQSWAWPDITAGSNAPFGEVRMAPEPLLGAVPPFLAAITLGLLVGSLMFRRRRRALATVLVAVVVLGCAVDGALAGAVLPNNLGVAGVLSSGWVEVAAAAALVPLLAVPRALVLLVRAGATQEPQAPTDISSPGPPCPG